MINLRQNYEEDDPLSSSLIKLNNSAIIYVYYIYILPVERCIERQRREDVVVSSSFRSRRQRNGGRANDRFEKLRIDLGNGVVNAYKKRKR